MKIHFTYDTELRMSGNEHACHSGRLSTFVTTLAESVTCINCGHIARHTEAHHPRFSTRKKIRALEAKIEILSEIMQRYPGVWSDESRLRSLAENLDVPDPNAHPELPIQT